MLVLLRLLADAIKAWSDVVPVTGVDCVFDVLVCRSFDVKGYPTLRFIGDYRFKLNIINWFLSIHNITTYQPGHSQFYLLEFVTCGYTFD